MFDTRDALTARPGAPPSPETRGCADLLAGVDVPELEPVPRDHVVTKTFYLIDSFLGRTTSGQTWIEALPPRSRRRRAAGARRRQRVADHHHLQRPRRRLGRRTAAASRSIRCVPGGTAPARTGASRRRQLVMYALTGNYKADQVHVRDLLEQARPVTHDTTSDIALAPLLALAARCWPLVARRARRRRARLCARRAGAFMRALGLALVLLRASPIPRSCARSASG